MKLYNTMSRQVEELKPLEDKKVKIYNCGLTVYSHPHIGNWLGYIYWDVLVRLLRETGYQVERTQNITDVGHLVSDDDSGEDKMEKGARQHGMTAWEVADKYTEVADHEAYEVLRLIRPDHLISATSCIDRQIEFAKQLDDKGFLYKTDDGMYFDTSKLDDYGKLARLDVEGLEAGARVSMAGKRNPTDFAVWKFSPQDAQRDMEWWAPWPKDGDEGDEKHLVGMSRAAYSDALQGDSEQQTESYKEYGEGVAELSTQQSAESTDGLASSASQQGGAVRGSWGFPGWHLECSTIALKTLGDQIDIHTGGIDHIPVHHTNEIAQTESLTGKPFANIWLHNNHIKVDGHKMSKSLGNTYTLGDITERGFDIDAFKLLVLSKHYRTEGNFTWEILQSAQNRLNNWKSFAALRHQIHDTLQPSQERISDEKSINFWATKQALIETLSDDLNTPEGLSLIDQTFSRLDNKPLNRVDKSSFINLLETINQLLGIDLMVATPDISDHQKQLIIERTRAREQKDWEASDQLRDQLFEQGIAIKDTSSGTTWSYRN